MNKFETLTKYIPLLEKDNLGTWSTDLEHHDERSSGFPFVIYSVLINQFIRDIYEFQENNPDMELNVYQTILEKHNIEWKLESLINADHTLLDAQAIMALILGSIRAERLNAGVLLEMLENKCIEKWLKRLKQIDEL